MTLTDLRFALEFQRASLVRSDGKWTIEPGGAPVPQRIADQARALPGVMRIETRLGGYEAYAWRAAA